MPATSVLDYNASQQAWEPRNHKVGGGSLIAHHAAAVRDGGSEAHVLYQTASDGKVYQTETGSDDNGVAIAWSITSKQYDLGGIARLQNLFLRLDPVVVDTVTITVAAMGTEYGTVTQVYTRSLNTLELRVRLHRTLIGRWVQVTIAGSMSNRPAPHDLVVEYVPFRQPRINS